MNIIVLLADSNLRNFKALPQNHLVFAPNVMKRLKEKLVVEQGLFLKVVDFILQIIKIRKPVKAQLQKQLKARQQNLLKNKKL